MNDSLEEMAGESVSSVRFQAAMLERPFEQRELDVLYESFLESQQHSYNPSTDSFPSRTVRNDKFIDLFNSKALELEELRPSDLDITDTRFVGFHTLDQSEGVGFNRKELFTLMDTTVDYLNQIGIDVEWPGKCSFETEFKSNPTDTFYNFEDDQVHLLVDKAFCRRSIPAMIGNELVHKANRELITEDLSNVREDVRRYRTLNGYQKTILENEILDIPASYKHFFGGIFLSELDSESEEMSSATEFVETDKRTFGYEIQYSPIENHFYLAMYEEKDYDSMDEFSSYSTEISGNEWKQIINEITEFVGSEDLGVEVGSRIKSRYHEIKERSESLSHNIPKVKDRYPLEDFEVKDEALTWATYFWIDRGFPDTSNEEDLIDLKNIRGYYNANSSYSDNAGDAIVDEVLELSEFMQEMEESPEQSFSKIMDKDNRRKYLMERNLDY